MTISINEQDHKVAEFLKENNIKYDVKYLADRSNDEEWQCDEWIVSFKGESFSFKTGLGHRITFNNRYKFTLKEKDSIKQLRELLNTDRVTFTIQDRSVYAVKPTQASVLYCLLLDAQANDESFNNWCDNYGYDKDSMKAFKIYQACCDNAEKLNKVFSREQQNKLNELLEEY